MAVQVAGILAALQLLDGLLARAGTISNLIKQAQAEKRDVTEAELNSLAAADDAARHRLTQAIAAAQGGGVRPDPVPTPSPTTGTYEEWVDSFGPKNGAPPWVLERWNKEHGK